MSKQYDNLVNRLGEAGAKKYMVELRGKVKNPGFARMDKQKLHEIAKLGAKARHEKIPTTQKKQDPRSQTQS